MLDLTMTKLDAQQCITDIRDGLETAKNAAWKLWHFQGWRVLGYSSFSDCIESEFKLSKSQVYRLKDQGQIEHELAQETGKNIALKNSHTRELKILPDINDKVDALNAARNIAEVTNSALTAKHVQAGVQQVAAKKRVTSTRHKVVQLAHEQGRLTVGEADKMIQALNYVSPQAQLTIQELMTKYGVFKDARLIPLLGKDIDREQSHDPSRVFQWVKEGIVYDVPLKDANEKDYRRAKYEAARIRQEEAREHKNKEREAAGLKRIEPVTATLYRGDPEKTLRILQETLGDEDMRQIVQLMMTPKQEVVYAV